MKTFSKLLTSMCFVLCLMLLVGCKSPQSDSFENVKDSGTKIYYERTGYVSLTLSNDLKAIGNIIYFNDGSACVKQNSYISLCVNKDCFVNSNNISADLTHKRVLSGLKINDKVFSVDEINISKIYISENTSISAIYSSFDIVGLAINTSNEKLPNDKTIFDNDNLFYICTSDFSNIEDLSEVNKTYNINHILNISSHSNIQKFDIILELDTKELNLTTNLLIKTSDNKFYLFKICNCKYSCEKFNINITFSDDITTSDSIKK